jgi:hypothetical protein
MKRPLAWRIDDALGTTPLFDLIASGPRHGLAEWVSSIAVVVRSLASRRGRAWMAWRRAAWLGSLREPERLRRLDAIERLDRMRRVRVMPVQETGS